MSFVKHRWVKRLALLVCFLFVLATVIVCKAAEDKVIAYWENMKAARLLPQKDFKTIRIMQNMIINVLRLKIIHI